MLLLNTNIHSSLLTIQELADYLKVPISTVYYWTSQNKIPFRKVGRHLRFELETVNNHFKKTKDDVSSIRHQSKEKALDDEAIFSSLKNQFANPTNPKK